MAAFQMEELQLEIWPRAETTAAETAANVQQQQNWVNLQQQQGYTASIAIVNCSNEFSNVELLLIVWEKHLVNDQWSYIQQFSPWLRWCRSRITGPTLSCRRTRLRCSRKGAADCSQIFDKPSCTWEYTLAHWNTNIISAVMNARLQEVVRIVMPSNAKHHIAIVAYLCQR